MTPRQRVLAVLRGEKPDKIPFTIYEGKIPQCAVERRLRNEGLCIVNRHHSPVVREQPDCVFETHNYNENGKPRVRSVIRTPVGEVSTVREPAGFTSWTLEKLFKRPEGYKVLEFMASELGDKSFCMGTHFSMADIAVGTALGYLNFRFPDIAWQEGHANLAKLYDKLMQRPPFADTVPHD